MAELWGDKPAVRREVFACRTFPGDWRIEVIDERSGDGYVTIFAGPEAERRAREYDAWLNATGNLGWIQPRV